MRPASKKLVSVIIWAAIHVALISLGLLQPWKVESDLYSVLPDSSEFKNVSEAEKALSARSMRNFTVLVGHRDFAVAKSAAEALEASFASDSAFAETRLYVDDSAMQRMSDFFFEYRNVLQGKPVRDLLKAGLKAGDSSAFSAIADMARQKVYGAFTIADLSHLEDDPFLLGAESFDYFTLHSQLMGGRFTLRDGVLAAEDSSVSYVMWSAALSPTVSTMASDGHVLARLDRVLDSLCLVHVGLRIEKSGVPFHSYESSRNAQSEVAWISGVSIVLILLLLLWAFRTPVPIVCTLVAIGVAICAALLGTWALFGSIHVFTFVFGTSVIGVSIDYAIHFFTDWKHGTSKKGLDIRRHIFKGLLLGFMTTELSYIALTFADFPLLRQMAVFSIVGLASSFATILLLFPNLPIPQGDARAKSMAPTRIPAFILDIYDRFAPRTVVVAGIVLLLALVPGVLKQNIHTDMRALYAMSENLKRSEALNARLNNLGISANYFIVEGSSEQELLQNEESLVRRLDSVLDLTHDSVSSSVKPVLGGYLATSAYIPSLKVQEETFEGIRRLYASPVFGELLRDLNLSSDSVRVPDASPHYLTPQSEIPASFRSILSMLWIGEVNGKFFSAVFPLHVAADFAVSQFAEGMPFVYAVNKMDNVNATLTDLSRVALLLVALAYLVVFVVLVLVYGFVQALKVIRAPVISCFFIAAVFGYCGIPFNFFAIVGVILTLGIGIDYALFFKEGGARNLTTALAVMLSAMTTLISFGSLSFSSFVPVATFGFSVLLGILCCFALSPFSRR
ncbi:MMPL family transporter [Fibrobacter sp. UWH4]|uniref:MMPL family transporter n=1 Tax=Fibrobacter sp. UWH4 TaxID=1896210 RepID=UPI00091647DE|nr:MMPL family transporter [Fibrobacter sp. UWH4]SHK92126.1 Predicted exporter [Fibrobacter sp. UWH4]